MDWALLLELFGRTRGAVIQEPWFSTESTIKILPTQATQQKRNAFLVVQTKDLVRKFSESEKRIFEDFSSIETLPESSSTA